MRQKAIENLSWYLKRVSEIPRLTPLEEKQLARRIREHSDPVARQQMVQSNLLLVVKISQKYKSYHLSPIDLIAEGNIGLMRAVEGYDPEQNIRFSTYASWWIRQAISNAIMESEKTVHLPAYLTKLIAKWIRTKKRLHAELGREPEISEIALTLDLPMNKVKAVLQGLKTSSIQAPSGDENSVSLADIVHDSQEHAPDYELLCECDKPIVEAALDQLDDRSRKVISKRFGFQNEDHIPETYQQIGDQLGLTRERVRQIEKSALAKIKGLLYEKYV